MSLGTVLLIILILLLLGALPASPYSTSFCCSSPFSAELSKCSCLIGIANGAMLLLALSSRLSYSISGSR
jgi:Protein of unknown function (DUF3309)